MNCMVDTVGLFQGCDAPTPLFPMYLTQLAGFQLSNIEQIATEDQATWQGVWDDLQEVTKESFREDVIAEFGKRYMLKQITQTVDLGKIIDANNTTAVAGGIENGILIETNQVGSQCIGSNMMAIYIQSLNFYWIGTDPNPSLVIHFFNADTLEEEYTVTPTSVSAGWNNVLVDYEFEAGRIFVYCTGNFTDYAELDISQFNLDNFGSYTWGFGGTVNPYLYFSWGSCGIQSRLNGCTYNSGSGTFTNSMNTFGTSVIFSTRCTWDAVVCKNKRFFASAWQHKLAIELLNYRINTSRINRWSTINLQQAIDLQRQLEAKYRGGVFNEVKYIGKLPTAIESIQPNDRDGCLKANDYLMWRENLP